MDQGYNTSMTPCDLVQEVIICITPESIVVHNKVKKYGLQKSQGEGGGVQVGPRSILLIKYRDQLSWYNDQSGVSELLIMRDPQYGRMYFKPVKTVLAVKRPRSSASTYT